MENKPEMYDNFYTVDEVFNGLEKWEQEKKARKAAELNTIANENVIFFDVDDTLVLWTDKPNPDTDVKVTDPYDGKNVYVRAHKPHIKLLKNHSERGATVFVWSQNGFAWAEAVVKALELESYVSFILTKPRAYVDDLPVSEWLTERIYIKPTSNWGQTHE